MMLKDYKTALVHLQEMLKAPRTKFHYNGLILSSLAMMKLKKVDKAVKLLEKAIGDTPKRPEAYFYRGQAMYEKEDWAAGVKNFERA